MSDEPLPKRPSRKHLGIVLAGLPGLPLFYRVTFDAFREERWISAALCAFAAANTTHFAASTLWYWWTIPPEDVPVSSVEPNHSNVDDA